MLKIVLSIIVALGVAGVAYAAAETLDVEGGVAQYGMDDSLVCDDSGVSVHKTTLGATNDIIDYVTIGGIDDDCYNEFGASMRVGLTGTFGSEEIFNAPLPGTGNVQIGDISGMGLHLEDLQDVHVTFYN